MSMPEITRQGPVARAISTVIAGVSLCALAAGCGADVADLSALPDGARSVAVEPRVVVDGLIELGARADRVVIDEVIFHAPTVTLRDHDQVLADVLGSDPDNESPLLFRYDVNDRDGFGDVLGGERNWVLQDQGDLVFGFEHFGLQAPEREKLEDSTGVSLGELEGHTAVVHGYMLTRSAGDRTSRGFTVPCTADGTPDGNPAHCHSKLADGDPDGNPADGDPDGNPAVPRDGTRNDGDPDGNPAVPGQDDGDPDGNPSQDPDGGSAGKHVDRALSSDSAVVGVHESGNYALVPFFLVLDDTFALRVPAGDVLAGNVDAGQVLPIDLHVSLDQLLTDDLLHQLDAQASDDVAGPIVVKVVNGTSALAIGVQAEGVTRVRQTVSGPGIRVIGDRR